MNRDSDDKVWMISAFPTAARPKSVHNRDDWPTSEDGDFVALRNEREVSRGTSER